MSVANGGIRYLYVIVLKTLTNAAALRAATGALVSTPPTTTRVTVPMDTPEKTAG